MADNSDNQQSPANKSTINMARDPDKYRKFLYFHFHHRQYIQITNRYIIYKQDQLYYNLIDILCDSKINITNINIAMKRFVNKVGSLIRQHLKTLFGSTVKGTVVTSVDINTTANKVYKHNFSETTNISRNIESFTIQEISKLNIDCILMSPPCQPFTRVGLKKDSADNRCTSLLYILQLIPNITTLKYILLENVKGFECSQARDEVLSCMEKSEFNYKEFILTPCQFSIPNSRHRYYLIAKKRGLRFIFENHNLLTSIPEQILQLLPENIYKSLPVESKIFNSRSKTICYKIKHILEEEVDSRYLIPENVLIKRSNLLDVRTPESNGSCCFTKSYSHYVEGTGSVLSPYSEIEVQRQFEKFNNTELAHEIKAILDLKLRYFTPKEISRLMCFPKDFEFPNNLNIKQKYRLLGNSINVHVVSQLIYLLHYEDKE